MPKAIIIAAAIITLGILAQVARTQTTTIPASRGVVVAACGTAPWTYTAGQEQPLTVTTGGALCVNM